MPRGKPTLKPSIPPMNAGPTTTNPAPLIILQPHDGDTIQFNAYGLEIPEIVDALRLAIVHLLSKQAGVTMFDEVINRQQRIAVSRPLTKVEPSANGKTAPKKSKQPVRRSPAAIYRDDGSDDEPDLADPDLVDVLNEIHKEWS